MPGLFGSGSRKQRARNEHRERLEEERARRLHNQQRQQLREDELTQNGDLPALDGEDDAYYGEYDESVEFEDEPNGMSPVVDQPVARPALAQRSAPPPSLRDDPRIQHLLDEVDDLRLGMREMTAHIAGHQETIKAQEATIAKLTLALEQARQEAQQSAQARAQDENRTRQQLEHFEQRLDDSSRPLRSLQAHVTDMLEQQRRKVDDAVQNQERYNELVTAMEHMTAVNDRSSAIAHGLRDSVDSLRGELDELRRDVIRTDDSIKIVDQEARRRTSSVSETFDGFNGKIDELRSDLAHTFESLEDTRRGLVHVDPTLEELRSGALGVRQDLTRLQAQFDERLDQVVDKHDDDRQETDARFDQLRHALEERIERLNERLDETNETFRETTYKLSEINAQIEDLRQVDASLHRDVWYLHEQRVRVRLEQVQEELDVATAQRRDAESEARVGLGNRVRRKRTTDGASQ